MRLIKPNFKNSIVNVSATIANFLGATNNLPKIRLIEKYLKRNYKNIVYLCLDGLGIYPITQNLRKSSFLYKNIKKKITSVFPSTTTNATSSLQSALYPSQHGMFGWSLYFEKLNRCVELYMGKDYYTGEKVDMSEINKILDFTPYVNLAKSDYKINTVFPPYIKSSVNNYYYKKNDEMFEKINQICSEDGKQFIYAYNGEPDHTMHDYGVTSSEAKNIINYLNDKVQQLMENNKDTLLIITPDHGQTDIKEYIELYDDQDLLKTLKVPMYLEARAVSFQVKDGQKEKFLNVMKKYKKDLKIFKVSDLVNKNFFGPKSDKLYLLGDYIAVVKNDYKIVLMDKDATRFKGHHTGLTKREMILPLIIIG